MMQGNRNLRHLQPVHIDTDYLWDVLLGLLEVPSPSGYTDHIVHHTVELLNSLEIKSELTRRGAIRARMTGRQTDPARSIVAHLDTLGAMVSGLKENGRLSILPIGTWSARFAEGARVTIFSDEGAHRGTILPLKASGHVYHEEVDTQPVSWDNLEVRVDQCCANVPQLEELGFHVGDFVAVDPTPEITPEGFVVSRHLDNKAGVAAMLAAAKAVKEADIRLPVSCHLLFTISEEVGSGASAVLHGNVAEMVSIDNSTPAPGQNSSEYGVTVACMDSSGPFDYHLTHHLLELSRIHGLRHCRDVFRHYRCDAAAAVEAGNDLRTALICFGADASHGYERAHVDSLRAVADLMALYMQSELVVARDVRPLGPITGFPEQPTAPSPAQPVVPSPLPQSE